MRISLLIVLAGVAASGCECFPQGTDDIYNLSDVFTGTVTAPARLGLPTSVPSNGGLDPAAGGGADMHDCSVTATCLQTPKVCSSTCFSFELLGPAPKSTQLTVGFTFDPRVAQSVSLPDPRVTVRASFATVFKGSSVTFEVTGGSFSSQIVGGLHLMHSEFSLDLLTSEGDQISITNGGETVWGRPGTRCHAD